jgi:hypothetical protein
MVELRSMVMNPNLPFTREQFLSMFEAYNQAIWPVQILAYVLGITAVALVVWRSRASDRLIAGTLGVCWLWLSGVFLWTFMRTIDTGPGPVVFAAAFAVQGVLWFAVGVLRHDLRFEARISALSIVGGLMILYAMLLYPLLGLAVGHVYPRQPMFGVAPCPTTIFTFGLLLLTGTRVSRYLLVIPFIWSVTSGISAPLNYGVYEDLGLFVAGVVGTALLVWRDRRVVARPLLQPQHA